jgi:hypothetical protein
MPGLVFNNKVAKKPFLARKLEVCNDVEMNPGPRKNSLAPPASPTNKSKPSNGNNMNSQNSENNDRDLMPANDVPRIKKLGKCF